MKKLEKILTALMLVLFGAAVAFVVTYTELTDSYSESLRAVSDSEIVSKTAELESYIDKYFVGEADKTAMADAAADAIVTATGDRWSYYISAADYESYLEQMQNAYVGIGVTIQAAEDGSGYEIMEVTAGGPAEEAGVLPGDILTAVEGTPIAALEVTAVKNLVRGEAGTAVNLTLQRDGEELQIAVERRQIEQQAASGRMLEGSIGYVQILNFDQNCAAHTIAATEDLIAQGATSLVFDVRNNPGGYKDELVKVLDYLLPEGVLFRMVDYAGTETVDSSDASYVDLPMTVLVNGDSYSAAEFFAAALQEYGAATVVGEKTCGKGYFQNTYRLSDGSAVALSSGTYYTPNGVSLANVGVTPDQEIAMDEESYAKLYYGQLDDADDSQLQAAITALQGK
ncbi:MAG: S41 family peptidase [Oscillospiraceae bacterium]|nr:S41 family peptidase [Oscillospiraceae bacterium]